MSEVGERIDRILDVPGELAAYERWLVQQNAKRDDYLFAAARVRFEAEEADVLVAPADLAVSVRNNQLELRSQTLGGGVQLAGLQAKAVERVLGWIDGQRTLAELRSASGRDRPALERLLSQALGLILFVPQAVAALEAALPGTEIVRFPGAPYEIVRNYWTNMVSVRREAEASLDLLGSDPRTWLRRLHVVLLLGADLKTFYRPASRITQKGVQAGAFYETPARIVQTGDERLMVSGPRVGVGFIGGERYHRLLATGAGDPGSLLGERELRDAEGIDWGGVMNARSADEEHDGAWFCPPRPFLPAHFDRLFSAYRSAIAATDAGDAAEAVRQLSRFHYRFIRLHPFRCANQSLAMNLVNAVLARALGAGMPHLVLDQLALRFQESAYERVFELAAREYTVAAEPVERWRVHREKKARAYALIERLKQSTTDAEAGAHVAADSIAANEALIIG